MEKNISLDILKQAILMEKRGKVFYASAAENSQDPDVKNIFRIMAGEEDKHIDFLVEQFQKFQGNGRFDFSILSEAGDHTIADQVISKSISDKVSSVGFEASAISLAIDMENRAIIVYSEQAKNATDPEEKKFYQWLANWEHGHQRILLQLDRELREKVWMDNNFWAF